MPIVKNKLITNLEVATILGVSISMEEVPNATDAHGDRSFTYFSQCKRC